jgi:hypothetical protein
VVVVPRDEALEAEPGAPITLWEAQALAGFVDRDEDARKRLDAGEITTREYNDENRAAAMQLLGFVGSMVEAWRGAGVVQ